MRQKTPMEIANDEFAEADIRAMTDLQRLELAVALQHAYNDLMRTIEDYIDTVQSSSADDIHVEALNVLCDTVGYR